MICGPLQSEGGSRFLHSPEQLSNLDIQEQLEGEARGLKAVNDVLSLPLPRHNDSSMFTQPLHRDGIKPV